MSRHEDKSARTMQPLSPLHRAAQRGDVEELRRLAKRVRHSTLCTQHKCMLISTYFLRPRMAAIYVGDHCRVLQT